MVWPPTPADPTELRQVYPFTGLALTTAASLVNTDRFPRGWRLSIGDYKRPLVKGLVNLTEEVGHALSAAKNNFI